LSSCDIVMFFILSFFFGPDFGCCIPSARILHVDLTRATHGHHVCSCTATISTGTHRLFLDLIFFSHPFFSVSVPASTLFFSVWLGICALVPLTFRTSSLLLDDAPAGRNPFFHPFSKRFQRVRDFPLALLEHSLFSLT